MSGSWFGLVCKLQASKVGHSKTGGHFWDLAKFLSVEIAPLADLWAIFEHVLASFMRWSY
jgi:hypothetical protein